MHYTALQFWSAKFSQIFVVSSDINCSPTIAARVINLLALHSSGSPKQSFPMFFSSLPQSDGKSSSLPSALSELIVLGPKKTLLTPLVKGLETEIVLVCQTSDLGGEIFQLSVRVIQVKLLGETETHQRVSVICYS